MRRSLHSKFILLSVVLCGVIPHMALLLLRMDFIVRDMAPVRVETYRNFFVCQWIPFWLTFLSYLRLQKQDDFSLIPAICAAVIVLTYLPAFPRRSVMGMLLTVPLILAPELSGLMKKAENAKKKALSGIAADRGALRAFAYWTLVFLCVVHISCKACTYAVTVVSPFQLLPIPGILVYAVFRHQREKPPAPGSLAVMLAMMPLSLQLAAIGPMEQFQGYHLMSLGSGYAFLLILLAVYNLDRWKKPA